MPDRRGRMAILAELLPEDRVVWARETWADRVQFAELSSGPWLLLEAAKALGIEDSEVDQVHRK